MSQIQRCDWLPERKRWSSIARPGFLAWSRKIKFFFGVLSHIINPLLTKLVRSRWLDIGLVLFFYCVFMDFNFVSVQKHAKKELGQYPVILTSRLVNNPYLLKHQPYLALGYQLRTLYRNQIIPDQRIKS